MRLSRYLSSQSEDGKLQYDKLSNSWYIRLLDKQDSSFLREKDEINGWDEIKGISNKKYKTREEAYQDMKALYKKYNLLVPSEKIILKNIYFFTDWEDINIQKSETVKNVWQITLSPLIYLINDQRISKEQIKTFSESSKDIQFETLREASFYLKEWLVYNKLID